jgi:hypothetical protein
MFGFSSAALRRYSICLIALNLSLISSSVVAQTPCGTVAGIPGVSGSRVISLGDSATGFYTATYNPTVQNQLISRFVDVAQKVTETSAQVQPGTFTYIVTNVIAYDAIAHRFTLTPKYGHGLYVDQFGGQIDYVFTVEEPNNYWSYYGSVGYGSLVCGTLGLNPAQVVNYIQSQFGVQNVTELSMLVLDPSAVAVQADIDSLVSQVSGLKSEVTGLEFQTGATQNTLTQTQSELVAAQAKLAGMTSQLQTLRASLLNDTKIAKRSLGRLLRKRNTVKNSDTVAIRESFRRLGKIKAQVTAIKTS